MRRSRAQGIGLWLLAFEMLKARSIPPVTLALIATQVLLYLQVFNIVMPLNSVCVSATHVWYHEEWRRLLTAAIFHVDDLHLYYNMISFLSKGRTLERLYGSAAFFLLLLFFTISVSAVSVGLSFVAAYILDDVAYLSHCAVGFSGVLFSLKVLATHMTADTDQYVMGIPMPGRWVSWVELLIIQLIVPNASFIGHLAGILVGLFYVKGPIHWLISWCGRTRSSYSYQSAPTGWRDSTSQLQFSDVFNEEEHMAAAMRNSLVNPNGVMPGGLHMSTSRVSPHNMERLTGGLSEAEQMAIALRESQDDANQQTASDSVQPSAPPVEPSAPPVEPDVNIPPPPSYHELFSTPSSPPPEQPELPNMDEMRRRRVARFHNT